MNRPGTAAQPSHDAKAMLADIKSGYPVLSPDPDYPPLRLKSI